MTAVQLAPDPPGVVPKSSSDSPLPPQKSGGEAERRWLADYGSRRILGMRVDATSYAETTAAVAELAHARAGGMVCVANVHMVMEAFDDPEFQCSVNSSDRVTPDGVPLVAALRSLGLPRAQRVYGPTLTHRVCERAAELGLPVGFYGGTSDDHELFGALLENLVEVVAGSFAEAGESAVLERSRVEAHLSALREWGRGEGRAIWYSLPFAEGRRPAPSS